MSEFKNIGNTSTVLTAYVFNKLVNSIMHKLEKDHPTILNEKVSQIYGFSGYEKAKPNLKNELEKLSGKYINGKYLYDKKRALSLGKPFITINKPYSHLLFEYIGHDNILSFVQKVIVNKEKQDEQLSILQTNKQNQNYYYVSYHFGEYKEIVKSQVTVKDNWKRIEYNYVYPQENGEIKYFLYYGDIKKRNDALHIQTRTFLDGKMVPSGENILYIGYGDPAKSQFLLGVFSAFDINNKLIAVKTIHERCKSKEEMEHKSLNKKVPGYIVQELRNQRIENEIHIPNDILELSPKSPFYLTYEKLSGIYYFAFDSEHTQTPQLTIKINPETYKISSPDSGILISHDDIQLIHNASIVNLKLQLSGITPFVQLDIYFKTYYLKNESHEVIGKYSGIDLENRLKSGNVSIKFESAN